jgi:hypothetical protein
VTEPELLEPVEPVEAVEPLEPVLLEKPDELEPAVSEEPLLSLSPEVVAALVLAAGLVVFVRDSAGSCPVTSTTAITAHTTMNSATE